MLLNLKSWSLRYTVSLDFILSVLLEYFQRVRRTNTGFFGVGVAQLTGPRAQEILEQAIRTSFPADEHIAVRNSDIRVRLLDHQLQEYTQHGQTHEDDLQQYRERIRRVHEENAKLPAKYTRPWRTNPFR